MSANWKLETLSVPAGYWPDPKPEAVAVPICRSAAHAFDSAPQRADLQQALQSV